ncbi:hypothetical protein D920_01519 [Enterococcus faecalis 13-SD-W-01]|nr:hypothetical protein D920_01519 [Enterococcus faecalis 13-SD-W-01]
MFWISLFLFLRKEQDFVIEAKPLAETRLFSMFHRENKQFLPCFMVKYN